MSIENKKGNTKMNTTKKIVASLGLGALMLTGLTAMATTPARADGLSFADINGQVSVAYTQGCAPAPVYVAPAAVYVAPTVVYPRPVIVRHPDFGRGRGDWNHGRR